jgi:hypothetical protein
LLAYVSGGNLWPIRIFAGIVGLAFACWPNFANRVVEATERLAPHKKTNTEVEL